MRKALHFAKDVGAFIKETWPLILGTLILTLLKITPWVATAYIAAHFIYKYW